MCVYWIQHKVHFFFVNLSNNDAVAETWTVNTYFAVYRNGKVCYRNSGCWSCFMDISICNSEKTIPKTLFWFLQPPCVHSPCNFSSDIGLALYWRLEVSNLWCGIKIFTPTGTCPFEGNLTIIFTWIWVFLIV